MSNFPLQWGVFETERNCAQEINGIRLDCRIRQFDNGTVSQFNGATRANIQPNPDIAGIGTMVAFLVLSAFANIFGLSILCFAGSALPTKRRQSTNYRPGGNRPYPGPRGIYNRDADRGHRRYSILETLLRAISDAQILLGLALAVSFIILDRCKVLEYHFKVGMNLLLIACANFLMTFALIRHAWSRKAWIGTILRLAAFVSVMVFLCWILTLQNAAPYKNDRPFVAEASPPDDRSDSVILLPAVCFLDRDFQTRVFSNMTSDLRAQVGLVENTGREAEWIIWLLLTVGSGFVLFFRLLGYCGSRRRPHLANLPSPAGCGSWAAMYWLLIWVMNMVVLGWCASTIYHLREWTDHSGWLQTDENGKNPESNVKGFGQTLALFSIVGVILSMLDVFSEGGGEREEGHENGPMAYRP